MDQITISELDVLFFVGVPDAERERPQRLLVTLVLEHDFAKAAASDDLAATIDYAGVCQRVTDLGRDRSWRLIERLAEDIAALVLAEFKPVRVTVEIKKFILPETKYVAVRVTRPRD